MTKSKLFLCSIISILLFSFSIKNNSEIFEKKGFIYKVQLNVDEDLMERALVKNADNSIFFVHEMGYAMYRDNVDERFLERNRLDNPNNVNTYEMFNSKETDKLLSGLSAIIATNTDTETVNYFKKKSKAGKMFGKALGMMGNVVTNATGKNKLSFSLPNKKLKRVKFKADEYYEIKMNFVFGGERGDYIKKNKQKGQPNIKFKIKTLVIASDKKGNILWTKEKDIKDFSPIFNASDIIEDTKGAFFNLKRFTRYYNPNRHKGIGDFLSLSKEEFEKCINFSLQQVLTK
jgi:hypothetical protein